MSDIERQETTLDHLAHYDALTDLPNRVLIAKRWQMATAAAKIDGTYAGVAAIDIDHFMSVTEAFGHPAGEQLLVELGRRLCATGKRRTGTVGSLGNDGFVVVLGGLRSRTAAVAVGKEFAASVARSVVVDGHELAVAASIGISVDEMRDQSFSEALRRAEVAKRSLTARGGDGVAVYEPSAETETAEQVTLGADLRAAIDRGDLDLHYQPVIDACSGKVLAVEALARWDHPVRGPIPPMEFAAAAERSGLIIGLGYWALERALDDLGRWHAAGLDLGVHVNVSARQLGDRTFVDRVVGEIEARGLARGLLTLELTESILIQDLSRVHQDLVQLRAAGVRISLDDFGTGFSSVGYLHRLPIDEIKIDKTLIIGAVDDARRVPMLRALREVARGLDLTFVAEGVEDEPTWDLIASWGDACVQGFGIGRPMAAEALPAWVARHRLRVESREAASAAAIAVRSLRTAERLEELSGTARPLDDVLTNLWYEMRDLVPYDRISVALLEDGGRTLRAHWAKASYGTALRLASGYSAAMAGSSLEDVLRTRKPRIINDLVAYLAQKPDSMSTRLIVGEGVRSSLTCPLAVGDTPVGFMFFSSRRSRAYREMDSAAFESIAAVVSANIARSAEAAPRIVVARRTARATPVGAQPVRDPSLTRPKSGRVRHH